MSVNRIGKFGWLVLTVSLLAWPVAWGQTAPSDEVAGMPATRPAQAEPPLPPRLRALRENLR